MVQLMSKAPGNSPWDAEAVETILSDLKDRTERGEPIRMVWPDPSPRDHDRDARETIGSIDFRRRQAEEKTRKAPPSVRDRSRGIGERRLVFSWAWFA